MQLQLLTISPEGSIMPSQGMVGATVLPTLALLAPAMLQAADIRRRMVGSRPLVPRDF